MGLLFSLRSSQKPLRHTSSKQQMLARGCVLSPEHCTRELCFLWGQDWMNLDLTACGPVQRQHLVLLERQCTVSPELLTFLYCTQVPNHQGPDLSLCPHFFQRAVPILPPPARLLPQQQCPTLICWGRSVAMRTNIPSSGRARPTNSFESHPFSRRC